MITCYSKRASTTSQPARYYYRGDYYYFLLKFLMVNLQVLLQSIIMFMRALLIV